MDSIPKFLASVITIIIGVLVCVSLIISAVGINSARVYHASVIDQIEASNFSEAIIEKCLAAAEKNNYGLVVEDASTETGPYRYYKVTLTYNVSAPIFNKMHTGTIVGYALSGAHIDVVTPIVDAGLYESGSEYSKLLMSWADLERRGAVSISGGVLNTGSTAADLLSGDLIVPKGEAIHTIADSAFSECRGITGVKLPDSVSIIGANAFDGCISLQTVEIGQGVTTIKADAFVDCNNIALVNYIGDIRGWCDIDFGNANSNPIRGANLSIQGRVVEAVVLPMDVTSIGNAFVGCQSLKSVLIPDGSSLSQITVGAFAGCSNLLTVNIGSGVKDIFDNAFSNCVNLGSILIPASTEYISLSAFDGCNNLRNIYVADGNLNYHAENGRILVDSFGTVIAGSNP